MATKTVQASGNLQLASNTNTWGAAAPASGDTVVLGTNKLCWDLASRTNVTLTGDGGTLQISDGNKTLQVAAVTVGTNVGYINIQGGPRSLEYASSGSLTPRGLAGIG